MTPAPSVLYAALYGPQSAQLASSLPDVGEGLAAQLTELGHRPTVEGAEQLAANLDGARRAVLRLRESLIREGTDDSLP